MFLALALSCSDPEPTSAPIAPAPAAPVAPPALRGTLLDLDVPGGHGGAPAGMNFHVPPGTAVETFVGDLGESTLGLRLSVPAEGDALACTDRLPIGMAGSLVARVRIPALAAGPAGWHGLDLELRARDASGALVSPPGSRYVALHRWREPLADWAEVTSAFTTPPGAVTGEFCFRFVKSTGTLELDRVEVIGESPAPDAAPAAPAPVVAEAATPALVTPPSRWDLDQPGPTGAPEGTSFVLPAEAAGSSLRVDTLDGGATGVRIDVPMPGNALLCTVALDAAHARHASARVRASRVDGAAKPWSGLVAEVRYFDATGTRVGAASGPYANLQAWNTASGWTTMEQDFAPAAAATTAKLCFRFVDATGSAEVDWLAIR
jgi:hypothetical protein